MLARVLFQDSFRELNKKQNKARHITTFTYCEHCLWSMERQAEQIIWASKVVSRARYLAGYIRY